MTRSNQLTQSKFLSLYCDNVSVAQGFESLGETLVGIAPVVDGNNLPVVLCVGFQLRKLVLSVVDVGDDIYEQGLSRGRCIGTGY
jgi:hypothetical protein